jgi:dTDP-4-amino-4,6-dideoxygalactose transaminase
MYVPAWPGLSPADLLAPPAAAARPFPFDAPHLTYFYRARSAIYHLFRALRFRKDETVLVPDYHSGNEVWAIRAAGAAVRYYPITRNLEPDLDELARLCRSGARALFAIHFLGRPQPLKELSRLCREHGMLLIEDCALSLFSAAGGQPLWSRTAGSWRS